MKLTPIASPGAAPGAASAKSAEEQFRAMSETLLPSEKPAGRSMKLTPVATPGAAATTPSRMNFAGMALPPQVSKSLQPVMDITTGFNSALADLAGLPVEVVDSALKNLGGKGFLEKPGNAQKALKDELSALGVSADKTAVVNQLAGDFGDSLFQNTALLSILMASAPAMVAKQGAGMFSNLVRGSGKALQAAPGAAVASEVTATLGGEVGKRVGAQSGTQTGAALGEVAGAFGGGLLTLPGRIITKPLQIARDTMTVQKQAAKAGLAVSPLASKNPNTSLIQEGLDGVKVKIEKAIGQSVAKLGNPLDPIEQARISRQGLRNAYKPARAEESKLWQRVNQNQTMPSSGLKDYVNQMVKAVAAEVRPDFLPGDIIAKIRGLPESVTMQRVRDIGTLIFERRLAGAVPSQQGVLPMSDTLRRNLTLIQQELRNSVNEAFPNDIELKKASEFTTWLHDRFTRGPVGQFARPRAKDTQMPNIRTAGQNFVRQDGAGEQVADIAKRLNMPELETEAAGIVRAQFNEYAAGLDSSSPGAGMKYLDKPEVKAFMKGFPRIQAEMETELTNLRTLIDEQTTMNRSAFVRNLNEGPETAVARLFSSGTKVSDAKLVVGKLANDPEALQALRDATVNELMKRAHNEPTAAYDMLQGKDTGPMMQTILGDNYRRLERIVQAGTSLKQDKGGPIRQIVTRGSRVLGAFFGRALNTGTLQAPEFGARVAEGLVDRYLHSFQNEAFTRAVSDPRWETLLLARMPSDLDTSRAMVKNVRRITRGIEIVNTGVNYAREREKE